MDVKRKDIPDEPKQVNIQVPSIAVRNRFNDICHAEKKNQCETLLMLMDIYDKHSAENSSPAESDKFSIPMYVQSGMKRTITNIITFHGSFYHSSGWSPLKPLDKATARKLEEAFHCPVGDGSPFNYSHCLEVYYHYAQKHYLVHENIWVHVSDEYYDEAMNGHVQEHPLEVSRCAFVQDYEELVSKFQPFATTQELIGISRVIAPNIEEDYSIMDTLFNPTYLRTLILTQLDQSPK